MATFEEQLDSLLERAKSIVPPNKLKTAAEKQPADKWMNDVQIFYNTYLKGHALGQRINTILFHRSTGAFEAFAVTMLLWMKRMEFPRLISPDTARKTCLNMMCLFPMPIKTRKT